MDYALNNDDINNISLSGDYGVGKSSILESYKCERCKNKPGVFNKLSGRKDKTFLHISFMDFNQAENLWKTPIDETQINTSCNNKELNIELKLINQLINQIPAKKVKYSGFPRKIKGPNLSRILTFLFMLTITILSILGIFHRHKIVSVFENSKLTSLLINHPISLVIPLILSLNALCFMIIKFIHEIKFIPSELSIKDLSLSFENSTALSSLLDSYVNEIVYLFENCDANVIVFEDFDRYESPLVFSKLRNINKIIDKTKNIKFLYLINDNIFESSERVKFFDLIIPVLPITNIENVNFIIENSLPEDIHNEISKSLLKIISNYIDDYRLIKNIFNEFIILINLNSRKKINFDELLAIVIYKNVFPSDYIDLLNDNGFLYNLLTPSKNISINTNYLVEKLKIEIKTANNYLQNLQKKRYELIESNSYVDSIYNNTNLYNDFNARDIELEDMKQEYYRSREYEEYILDIEKTTLIDELNFGITKTRDLLKSLNEKKILEEQRLEGLTDNPTLSKNYKNLNQNKNINILKELVEGDFIKENYKDYLYM